MIWETQQLQFSMESLKHCQFLVITLLNLNILWNIVKMKIIKKMILKYKKKYKIKYKKKNNNKTLWIVMIVLVKKFLMINNKNIICLKLKENMMIKMM
jgi:hypothetical protein